VEKRIHNIQKTQQNTENGGHHAKHQMQTNNWKSRQYTSKSKIANEGGPWQT